MSAPRALRIGDLAAAAGVARSLIRYYETCGLLPAPPRAGGVRRYGAGALGRLQHVLVVRRLGLSIDETRTALANDRALPAIAAAHIAALDDEIRRLRVRRALLRHAGESGAVPSARYARVLAKVGA
jgi:DNA-binding transcriptional MerR regulator